MAVREEFDPSKHIRRVLEIVAAAYKSGHVPTAEVPPTCELRPMDEWDRFAAQQLYNSEDWHG